MEINSLTIFGTFHQKVLNFGWVKKGGRTQTGLLEKGERRALILKKGGVSHLGFPPGD